MDAGEPHTVKALRKAAACDVDNQRVFEQTKYGRARIPSIPMQLLAGVVLLVSLPFIALYHLMRRKPSP